MVAEQELRCPLQHQFFARPERVGDQLKRTDTGV